MSLLYESIVHSVTSTALLKELMEAGITRRQLDTVKDYLEEHKDDIQALQDFAAQYNTTLGSLSKVQDIRKLLPDMKMWDNYKAFAITGLQEQIALENAHRVLRDEFLTLPCFKQKQESEHV